MLGRDWCCRVVVMLLYCIKTFETLNKSSSFCYSVVLRPQLWTHITGGYNITIKTSCKKVLIRIELLPFKNCCCISKPALTDVSVYSFSLLRSSAVALLVACFSSLLLLISSRLVRKLVELLLTLAGSVFLSLM